MNLPPTVTGQIPADWAAPAVAFGKALHSSFSKPKAVLLSKNTSVECGPTAAGLELAIPSAAAGKTTKGPFFGPLCILKMIILS